MNLKETVDKFAKENSSLIYATYDNPNGATIEFNNGVVVGDITNEITSTFKKSLFHVNCNKRMLLTIAL